VIVVLLWSGNAGQALSALAHFLGPGQLLTIGDGTGLMAGVVSQHGWRANQDERHH
jgi:hypothetical protein